MYMYTLYHHNSLDFLDHFLLISVHNYKDFDDQAGLGQIYEARGILKRSNSIWIKEDRHLCLHFS